MMRKNKEKGLKIAMLGQKEVPSRSGGIEVVLTTLCPLLVKKGNFVTCYNRSHEKSEEEYKEIQGRKEYKGVSLKKVWTLNRNGLSAVTASFSAAILAAIGKYDIVHFHAEGPAAALWIPKMFGKRCVVTVHGLDWKREKWSGTFGSKYIKFGEKVLVKYADRIIVLSEDVQRYFKDTYHRDTVFIPNGVSKNKVREADLITEKFGLEKGEYFCSVSRLTEEKGILQYFSVSAVDADGTLDYNNSEKLKVEVSGAAEWMVCGNADPKSTHIPSDPEFALFEGKGQIIVRKKNAQEVVTLTVHRLSDGNNVTQIC